MRLGIGSYCYVWAVGIPGYAAPEPPLSVEQLLEKATKLGVHVVQIADNLPLHALSAAEQDKVYQSARRRGIHLELGTCGIEPDHLLKYLEICSRMKAPLLRTLLDSPGQCSSPGEAVAKLRCVSAAFAAAGVSLAIENHDRLPAAALAEIVRQVDSPRVGICLDTANSLSCLETPATVVEIFGPWTLNLHVKDFRYVRLPHGKGFVVEGCSAGRGQLDIPWLLAALGKQRPSLSAIVELWPPPEATVEQSVAKEEAWTAESVRYLRQYIVD
jgi:3-oxoisoapionate decarboxylase